MRKTILIAALLPLLAIPVTSFSKEPIIYPNNGQSAQQLEKDKYECYAWAKGQTNFDPMQVPTTTTPPPQQTQPKSGLVKGAARGALLGTAVGAIAGDTGKGAAIGAAAGGIGGKMRRNNQAAQQKNAEKQWAQKETSQYANQRSAYDRAYSACLGGRGYTVN